ncbi:MAG TPA: iron ABC transporter permease, partial [Thermoplasmataceae archaeon]|nr:iron ABC transporter permease [Thermoplasmataceae archaeon]
ITWTELLPVSAIVISTSLIISLYHRELDALQLGEFHARSVGVSVENVKRVMIVLVTLSVSAAVSVSGIIGFVGLIMPHISRLLYGGSNRFVIPSSAIMGAIFLLAADDISRVVITGEVVPIGVVTGMIGVPVFMYLLRRLSGGVYEH